MEAFDKNVNNYLSFMNNEYVSAGLSLFLILYAGLAAPKLPEAVAGLFDYMLVKLILFFLIVYSSRKNPTVAIIAAIAVLVSLQTLGRYKFNREMMEIVAAEEASKSTSEDGSIKLVSEENKIKLVSEHECTDCQVKEVASTTGSLAGEEYAHPSGEGKIDVVLVPEEQQRLDSIRHLEQSPDVLVAIDVASTVAQVVPNSVEQVIASEEKIKTVLVAKTQIEEESGRKMTSDELKSLCAQVNHEFETGHIGANENSEIGAYDPSDFFATV